MLLLHKFPLINQKTHTPLRHVKMHTKKYTPSINKWNTPLTQAPPPQHTKTYTYMNTHTYTHAHTYTHTYTHLPPIHTAQHVRLAVLRADRLQCHRAYS